MAKLMPLWAALQGSKKESHSHLDVRGGLLSGTPSVVASPVTQHGIWKFDVSMEACTEH